MTQTLNHQNQVKQEKKHVQIYIFQITASIYRENYNSHENLTSVLLYMYFEIRCKLNLNKKSNTKYLMGGLRSDNFICC